MPGLCVRPLQHMAERRSVNRRRHFASDLHTSEGYELPFKRFLRKAGMLWQVCESTEPTGSKQVGMEPPILYLNVRAPNNAH